MFDQIADHDDSRPQWSERRLHAPVHVGPNQVIHTVMARALFDQDTVNVGLAAAFQPAPSVF